jgi:hypothetical protein
MTIGINSLFKQVFTTLIVLTVFYGNLSCSDYSDKQSDSKKDSLSEIVKIVNEKDKDSNLEKQVKQNIKNITVEEDALEKLVLKNKTDTQPKLKKPKTELPQNKMEILSLDLNQQVHSSQQLINLSINNKVQQLVQATDFTRKSIIMEISISYNTLLKNNYIVYINTDNPDLKKVAGHMTFFGLQDMSDPTMSLDGSKKFLFDITNKIDIKTLNESLKLLFVNSSGKPTNEITITKVRLEIRDF